MFFYADENFMLPAARILDIFEHENKIVHCYDYFDNRKSIPDTEWIRAIAKEKAKHLKVVVISQDLRILKNAAEKRALQECGYWFVTFHKSIMKFSWNEFAWKLLKAWPDIVEHVDKSKYPTVFEVMPGKSLKIRDHGLVSEN